MLKLARVNEAFTELEISEDEEEEEKNGILIDDSDLENDMPSSDCSEAENEMETVELE
jgi:hypothetical protein